MKKSLLVVAFYFVMTAVAIAASTTTQTTVVTDTVIPPKQESMTFVYDADIDGEDHYWYKTYPQISTYAPLTNGVIIRVYNDLGVFLFNEVVTAGQPFTVTGLGKGQSTGSWLIFFDIITLTIDYKEVIQTEAQYIQIKSNRQYKVGNQFGGIVLWYNE